VEGVNVNALEGEAWALWVDLNYLLAVALKA